MLAQQNQYGDEGADYGQEMMHDPNQHYMQEQVKPEEDPI